MKRVLLRLAALLVRLLPPSLVRPALRVLATRLGSGDDQYFTYHLRPVSTRGMRFPPAGADGVAIVVQGPPMLDEDFTLETLALYRRNFPGARIFFSTWEDAAPAQLDTARSLGVEICLSPWPERSGIQNFNFQRTTTLAGIEAARRAGVEYILKCRSDQRFHASESIGHMRDLMAAFPLPSGISGQKERLVAVSLDSFKYRPYSISDMFLFGATDDVSKFWEIPSDLRTSVDLGTSLLQWSQAEICEAYLVVEFLRKLGRAPQWTLRDSWTAYRDHFCIVDASTVDLYWPKYEKYKEYRYRTYENELTSAELCWKDWLRLHSDPALIDAAPESVIHLGFGVPIPRKVV